MDYRTQTVTLSSATLIVRESRGLDLIDSSALFGKLTYNRKSKRELNRAQRFVNAFLRSEVSGDMGFPWADFDASDAEVQATFEGWQSLSADDMAAWEVALNEVNKAVVDPLPEAPVTAGA